MKQLGILGYPLSHSISPEFQQAALDHHKIKAEFHRWEIKTDELNSFFETFQDADFVGASVTIPYKENIMEFLDEINPRAESIASVNCIIKSKSRISFYHSYGFNLNSCTLR